VSGCCSVSYVGWRVEGPTPLPPRAQPGLPDYRNWELPTEDAYGRFIEGWSGQSPSHWLRKEAGFSGRILSAFGYKKWIKDDYSVTSQGPASLLTVRTFDLYYAQRDLHFLLWSLDRSQESEFNGVHGGLMYKRQTSPDESYWWSG
jgi:hypothetical protein